MRLLSVKKSDKPAKKFMATFRLDNGNTRIVYFGAANMDDYTITHDKEQRERYRTRHKKDLETNDPTRPGYLSYYILWGDSTSIRQNIKTYKEKFNL